MRSSSLFCTACTTMAVGFASLWLSMAMPLQAAEPMLRGELIFPLESWHNHGSCIVECPNGDRLVCWFHGSGERKADDVEILGARWRKSTGTWTKPFSMADTPEFPDTNCCMIIDRQQRLWLLWPTIQANLWESALMKYKTSTDFMMPEGPPQWDLMRVLHVKHQGDFAAKVKQKTEDYVANQLQDDAQVTKRVQAWQQHLQSQADDKLTRRLGWFTRAHPLILNDGRMLVGSTPTAFRSRWLALPTMKGKPGSSVNRLSAAAIFSQVLRGVRMAPSWLLCATTDRRPRKCSCPNRPIEVKPGVPSTITR